MHAPASVGSVLSISLDTVQKLLRTPDSWSLVSRQDFEETYIGARKNSLLMTLSSVFIP